uniref:Pre-mRNA-splicing factor CWC25-like protein n=1 Tax=Globodera rostochiensis TaxID=31243 RepID=A0A914HA45_GLORO
MSNTTSASDDKKLQWMYEGTRSMVNREDYLLGKKIDKNFEMFSDVVVRDQEEEKRETFFQQSLLQPSTSVAQHKVSALETRIVRTEDPLVALKFQEEQRKRQILENPLLKLKAQRVLRKAFEKELKKAAKKSKEHKRRRSNSSSDDEVKEQKKRRGESSTKESEHGRGRRSNSRKEKRRSSNSRTTRDRSREAVGSSRSDSKRGKDASSSAGASISKSKVSESMKAAPTARLTAPPSKKLTAEELEKRRRAMLANASWRDEMRERNIREAAEKLGKERDEMSTNRCSGFMRPMMHNATEGSTIEQRLQSNRMNIQRQHDHMDKSFVRK